MLILEPKVFGDPRGFFFESFNSRTFADPTSLNPDFVQDNHLRSARKVLRDLHYRIHHLQGELVRVASGEAFDVAVDLRRSTPTFGRWCGTVLSAENKRMLWIPEGFAHGFLFVSESEDFLYKTTNYYALAYERCSAGMIRTSASIGFRRIRSWFQQKISKGPHSATPRYSLNIRHGLTNPAHPADRQQ